MSLQFTPIYADQIYTMEDLVRSSDFVQEDSRDEGTREVFKEAG